MDRETIKELAQHALRLTEHDRRLIKTEEQLQTLFVDLPKREALVDTRIAGAEKEITGLGNKVDALTIRVDAGLEEAKKASEYIGDQKKYRQKRERTEYAQQVATKRTLTGIISLLVAIFVLVVGNFVSRLLTSIPDNYNLGLLVALIVIGMMALIILFSKLRQFNYIAALKPDADLDEDD